MDVTEVKPFTRYSVFTTDNPHGYPGSVWVKTTDEMLSRSIPGKVLFEEIKTHVPTISQIVQWLGADKDNIVEFWNSAEGRWQATEATISAWRERMDKFTDLEQPGYQLGVRIRPEVRTVCDLGIITQAEWQAILQLSIDS